MTALVEGIVALLVVASGLAALVAAIGLVRLRNFFMRMHPPALASTLATWLAALASIVWFTAGDGRLVLYPWIVVVLMSITAPVTTTLLARAALLRRRVTGGDDVPPPLPAAGTPPAAP